MGIKSRTVALTLAVFLAGTMLAGAYSIDAKILDAKKIYWGEASGFDKPAEVKYEDVVTATPQYVQIKKEKIQRGTGKYWILMSQSSDHAVRAIAAVATDEKNDLVASAGYLGGLEAPIPAQDITKTVIAAVKGKWKPKPEKQPEEQAEAGSE